MSTSEKTLDMSGRTIPIINRENHHIKKHNMAICSPGHLNYESLFASCDLVRLEFIQTYHGEKDTKVKNNEHLFPDLVNILDHHKKNYKSNKQARSKTHHRRKKKEEMEREKERKRDREREDGEDGE